MRGIGFVLILMLLSLIFYPLKAQQDDLDFEQISIREGLSHSIVYSIVQDKDGFIWMGTQDGGLDRYDGYSIKNYSYNPDIQGTISGNNISDINVDSKGNIWIGTWGGGLNRYNPEKNVFQSWKHDPKNPQSISNNKVQDIFIDSKGKLWLGTDGGGLNVFNPATNSFTVYKNNPANQTSISSNKIWSVTEDNSGLFWVGTDEGLNQFDPKTEKFKRYLHNPSNPSSLSHSQARYVTKSENGTIWIGTASGINEYNSDNEGFKRYYAYPDKKNKQENNVNVILPDLSGHLWIGSQMGGLSKFDISSHSFTNYANNEHSNSSLSYNDVRDIMIDRSGIIWIATRGGGISRASLKSKFTTYRHLPDHINSLSGNRIRAISSKENKVWIGTDRNGISEFNINTKQWKQIISSPFSLSSHRIRAIFYDDAENALWVGTDDAGLNKLIPADYQSIQYKNIPGDNSSLSNNEVTCILKDSKGRLWVGTKSGLNLQKSNNQGFNKFFLHPDIKHTLSDNRIICLFEDAKNRIWIGTDNGLNLYDEKNENFLRFLNTPGEINSIADNDIFSIHQSKGDTLWIGTGNGLSRFIYFNNRSFFFKNFRQLEGIPGSAVYGILEDGKQNLWLSARKGLCKFNVPTETAKVFDVDDGLQSNEFSLGAYCKTADGAFFFGGINGLSSFHPSNIYDDTIQPNTVITDFKIMNESVSIGNYGLTKDISHSDSIVFSYHDYFFSVEFAALHYASSANNKYQYMLYPFHNEWVDANNQRYITFTNIPAGKYILKIKSANHDGVWEETPAEIYIEITPPFWQTWWFYITMGILIIASFYTYVWYSKLKLKQRNKNLEKIVDERTAEIIQQKEEILMQRDQISQNMDILVEQKKKITDSIEYALKIQQAILPSPNILQENFEDFFIFYKPKDIVSGDFYWWKLIDNHIIVVSADCTGHGVPGAFMSMLGLTFLDEIVTKDRITKPDLILNNLRDKVIKALKQKREEINKPRDGMDMAIASINLDSKLLEFSGAYNPLYLIRNGDLIQYKGDRMPVSLYSKIRQFTSQEIQLEKGDTFYTFSDGMIDQFGGAMYRKFLSKRLKTTLLENQDKSMKEQKDALNKAITKWMDDNQQIDDMVVLGIKV